MEAAGSTGGVGVGACMPGYENIPNPVLCCGGVGGITCKEGAQAAVQQAATIQPVGRVAH